jgi:hypothetical protein
MKIDAIALALYLLLAAVRSYRAPVLRLARSLCSSR